MTGDRTPHGPAWQAQVRASRVFACVVTPAWHRDEGCQAQLAYAREVGKPIYFVVQMAGGVVPPPREPGDYVLWVETPEDAAEMLWALLGAPQAPDAP